MPDLWGDIVSSGVLQLGGFRTEREFTYSCRMVEPSGDRWLLTPVTLDFSASVKDSGEVELQIRTGVIGAIHHRSRVYYGLHNGKVVAVNRASHFVACTGFEDSLIENGNPLYKNVGRWPQGFTLQRLIEEGPNGK